MASAPTPPMPEEGPPKKPGKMKKTASGTNLATGLPDLSADRIFTLEKQHSENHKNVLESIFKAIHALSHQMAHQEIVVQDLGNKFARQEESLAELSEKLEEFDTTTGMELDGIRKKLDAASSQVVMDEMSKRMEEMAGNIGAVVEGNDQMKKELDVKMGELQNAVNVMEEAVMPMADSVALSNHNVTKLTEDVESTVDEFNKRIVTLEQIPPITEPVAAFIETVEKKFPEIDRDIAEIHEQMNSRVRKASATPGADGADGGAGGGSSAPGGVPGSMADELLDLSDRRIPAIERQLRQMRGDFETKMDTDLAALKKSLEELRNGSFVPPARRVSMSMSMSVMSEEGKEGGEGAGDENAGENAGENAEGESASAANGEGGYAPPGMTGAAVDDGAMKRAIKKLKDHFSEEIRLVRSEIRRRDAGSLAAELKEKSEEMAAQLEKHEGLLEEMDKIKANRDEVEDTYGEKHRERERISAEIKQAISVLEAQMDFRVHQILNQESDTTRLMRDMEVFENSLRETTNKLRGNMEEFAGHRSDMQVSLNDIYAILELKINKENAVEIKSESYKQKVNREELGQLATSLSILVKSIADGEETVVEEIARVNKMVHRLAEGERQMLQEMADIRTIISGMDILPSQANFGSVGVGKLTNGGYDQCISCTQPVSMQQTTPVNVVQKGRPANVTERLGSPTRILPMDGRRPNAPYNAAKGDEAGKVRHMLRTKLYEEVDKFIKTNILPGRLDVFGEEHKLDGQVKGRVPPTYGVQEGHTGPVVYRAPSPSSRGSSVSPNRERPASTGDEKKPRDSGLLDPEEMGLQIHGGFKGNTLPPLGRSKGVPSAGSVRVDHEMESTTTVTSIRPKSSAQAAVRPIPAQLSYRPKVGSLLAQEHKTPKGALPKSSLYHQDGNGEGASPDHPQRAASAASAPS